MTMISSVNGRVNVSKKTSGRANKRVRKKSIKSLCALFVFPSICGLSFTFIRWACLASPLLSSSCLVGAVIVLVCGFFSYRRKAMLIPLQLSLSVLFSLCTFTISTTYKFDVCTHRQNQWLKIRAYSTESATTATATSNNNNNMRYNSAFQDNKTRPNL